MAEVFVVVLPLFLIVAGSATLQRLRHLGDQWPEVLNAFALNIGFPALILSALTKYRFALSDQLPLITINSVFLVATFAIAVIVCRILRLPARLSRPIVFCIGFGNVAYLGIPILLRVAGDTVLTSASMIVAVYLFWTFTLGVGFLEFTREDGSPPALRLILRRLVRNPLLLSVAGGILLSQSGFVLPDVFKQTLEMLSLSVTPLVLVLIGLFVGKADPGGLDRWIPVSLFVVVKLVVVPAIFIAGLAWTGADMKSFAPSIIESAMPIAITPFALAGAYDLDADFIARSIVLSTVLSIVTLPYWITLP